MLPQYGGYGGSKTRGFGGGGRGGGGGGGSAQLIALVVLGVLSTALSFGYYVSHRHGVSLKHELASVRSTLTTTEDQLTHQRSVYQHMEYEYHVCQRRVNDMTRETQQKEHILQQRQSEKDACNANESQLQQVIKELQEQLEYQQAVVDLHKTKLSDLEKAHATREHDWHELSKTWTRFEEEANKENARLLGELTKAQGANAPASAVPVPGPLPDAEPKVRPESTFDVKVNLPKEDEYVHHHGAAQYLRQLKERAAAAAAAAQASAGNAASGAAGGGAAGGAGGAGGAPVIPEGGLGAQDSDRVQAGGGAAAHARPGMAAHGMQSHHQPTQHQQQQQHGDQYGSGGAAGGGAGGAQHQYDSQFDSGHVAPSPVDHQHHGAHYDDHHWDSWADDPNHWVDEPREIDPVDDFWIHDGYMNSDNHHGDNVHAGHMGRWGDHDPHPLPPTGAHHDAPLPTHHQQQQQHNQQQYQQHNQQQQYQDHGAGGGRQPINGHHGAYQEATGGMRTQGNGVGGGDVHQQQQQYQQRQEQQYQQGGRGGPAAHGQGQGQHGQQQDNPHLLPRHGGQVHENQRW